MVERAFPAIFQLPGETPRFLFVLGGGRRIRVLGPGLDVHRLPAATLRAAGA